MKVLLYCTKGKDHLVKDYDLFEEFVGFKTTNDLTNSKSLSGISQTFNGKIIAECEIEKITEFDLQGNHLGYAINLKPLLSKSCLSIKDMRNYLGTKKGYALHLSNVKVLDKPYDLNEWFNKNEKPLVKAPQNMCHCYHWLGDEYILISIQPQHLVNILNGKKTIEIRKQILNVMKEKLC